jgi:hypothetical protein
MTKLRIQTIPDAPAQIPLATSHTPTQLTMQLVHAERSRDILPANGPHTPLVEEFHKDDLFETRWGGWTISGSASSIGLGGKLTVVAGGSGLDRVFKAPTKLAVPTGVFCAARIDPNYGTANGDEVAVGFYKESASEFVQATWNRNTGTVTITSGGGLTGTASVGTINPSAQPIWLALLFSYPASFALVSDDGRNWNVLGQVTVTGTDLRNPINWSTMRPGFRVKLAASATGIVTSFRAGYAGSYGFRDFKAVTYADGTPLRRDGLYYFTGTVATGNNDFQSNHMAVWSFNPTTYQTDLVHHLFYDVDGLGVGAGYGGQAVYDETTAEWLVVANTWGFGNQSTGIDLILAETTRDLTAQGISVLKAEIITPSPMSMYDSSVRRDLNGTWWLTAIETTKRTGWSANEHGPVVFTGPTLRNLTRFATATNTAVDGSQWAKIGGQWYVLGGSSNGFRAWNADLSNETLLSSWFNQLPAGLLGWGSFPSHPSFLVVDDGYQTRYLLATYDTSFVLGLGASKGGLVVLEADQKPTGQEFASKIVPRFYGT